MPLEITGLSKRYGDKWVLRDAEFAAREGSILGLLGATASGKSSLLNIVAGRVSSNGGSSLMDGIDLLAVRPRERGITMLPEPDRTSLLNLFAGPARMSSGETAINGLEEKLARSEKVVLLDDPFASLDPDLRRECFAVVRRAARSRDRIVIFATSDFGQLTEVADDLAVLAVGRIVQTGTPQEVYEEPNCIASAMLTGASNLLEARRLTSSDSELPEFHTIDGGHRIFAAPTEKSRLGSIHQNVKLCIRPEQVAISMGASFPEDNLLRAVVTAIRFRGSTSIVEFDASGLKIETRAFKVVGLNVGDECMLGLPPHRIIVLKD